MFSNNDKVYTDQKMHDDSVVTDKNIRTNIVITSILLQILEHFHCVGGLLANIQIILVIYTHTKGTLHVLFLCDY